MPPPSATIRTSVTRVTDGGSATGDDCLAVEEPLEIRVAAGDQERPLAVTMRTPGEDHELAAGFLMTESVIRRFDDIESVRHWGSPNVVRVALRAGVGIDWQRLQ